MSILINLLKTDPVAVDKLGIHQIVAMCGDGNLRDNSPCSRELREYLEVAKSENLFAYVESCLNERFEKGGFVLQDVVNELGRRLEYSVDNGLYQGKSSNVGNDGLWKDGNGHAIVVEVKTTDAYRINLDTLAKYRNQLSESGKIPPSSSVLLVVGRQDTGDLEAQVRGSRHAWVVRIISADAIKQLVWLKERAESASVEKIHELLIPFEYTRLDKIIGIAFAVAEDASSAASEDAPPVEIEPEISDEKRQQHTSSEIISSVRSAILERLGSDYPPLVKKSRALYWSADKTVRVAITISKEYPDGGFWYAYHDSWDSFLGEGETGLYVLGCVGRPDAFAIPREWMQKRLGLLYTTARENQRYHHILLYPNANGHLILQLRNGVEESLEAFRFSHKV